MPDQDRFEKSFASAWRKVLRLSKGGVASEAELSDAVITALAHSLRQSGGCPGLQDIADVLHGFVWNWEDLPLLSADSIGLSAGVEEALAQHFEGIDQYQNTLWNT